MQNVIYVFSHLYFNPYPHVCKLVGHRLLIIEIIDCRQSKTILKHFIMYPAESQATKLVSTLFMLYSTLPPASALSALARLCPAPARAPVLQLCAGLLAYILLDHV